MDEATQLEAELRAAREELVRSGSTPADDDWIEPGGRLPLLPDRDPAHLRLSLMNADQLERHIERLERDLDDLQNGFERDEEPDDQRPRRPESENRRTD